MMGKQGTPLAERSYNLPFPIGGRYAKGNIAQAQKYLDEGQTGFNAVNNPKRYDFSSAYLGNKNAGTMSDRELFAIIRGGIPEPLDHPSYARICGPNKQ
jgi:hypothetical protein